MSQNKSNKIGKIRNKGLPLSHKLRKKAKTLKKIRMRGGVGGINMTKLENLFPFSKFQILANCYPINGDPNNEKEARRTIRDSDLSKFKEEKLTYPIWVWRKKKILIRINLLLIRKS